MESFVGVPIGEVRDYWNQRPCNIRHSPAEIGTKEYFDQVEARKYFVEPHIPAFAEFEKWRGKRVLETGCGIGIKYPITSDTGMSKSVIFVFAGIGI